MRLTVSSSTLVALLGFIGCSSATSSLTGPGGNSTGGDTLSGSPSGGAKGGGTASSGGSTAQSNAGGNQNLGGSPTGGGPVTGGSVQNVGGARTGGAGNGGSPAGGNPTGGSPAGGNPAGGVPTGGAPAGGNPTGGNAVTAGGSPPTGGSPSSGCTDTPRTNSDGSLMETCANAKLWGFCGQSWFSGNGFCNATCGTCNSSISTGGSGNSNTGGRTGAGGTLAAGGNATGGNRTGGSPTGGQPAATGGNQGTSGSCNWTASSTTVSGQNGFGTRYWDCCMPSCSWSTQLPYCDSNGTTQHQGTSAGTKSGCDGGGNAYECYNFAPWYDSASNASYGFAAYNGAPCGSCYQLQFTGSSNGGSPTGAATLKGRVMFVQVINIGGLGGNQFDLLIPGGGVGAMTAGCTAQWGNVSLGATYGGFLSTCSGDVNCARNMCNSAFAGKTDLLNGCLWFTDCYNGADNPNFVYSKVTCPSQLTSRSHISG